ncbi:MULTISPECIES: DUF742 domain-containing protein [unclassified Streptomyces]|uniref:DUF742 domain-containing protein n=1 Tax=unclassified Streptomyces TaxID=2593676 RepID=UPI002ED3E1FF|nr:DUF742 domain-containing protein [Streptomyces sp. BE230]
MRPYVLVHGRVRPSRDLDRSCLLLASANPPAAALQPHHAQVLKVCSAGPRSVAEIAGTIDSPVQVIKIILSDLIDDGYVVSPTPAAFTDAATDESLLRGVLAGLRNL